VIEIWQHLTEPTIGFLQAVIVGVACGVIFRVVGYREGKRDCDR